MKRILVLILLAAVFLSLRARDLGTLPAWDWDEGVNYEVASNIARDGLSDGSTRMFSMKYFFVPHPPLYFVLCGFLFRFFGESVFVLRGFSVFLGLCSLFLLFFVGSRVGGFRLGFLSALLFAVYPGGVYWGRLAYANHLLGFFWLLAIYLYLVGGRWVYASSFFAGLCALTEYPGVAVVFSVLYLFYRDKRKGLPYAVFLSLAPFCSFVVFMAAKHGRFFFMDFYGSFAWHILRSSGLFFMLVLALYAVLFRVFRVSLRSLLASWGCIFADDARFILKERANLVLGRNLVLVFAPFYLYLLLSYPLKLSDDVLFFGMDFLWLGLFGVFWVPSLRKEVLSFFAPLFLLIFLVGRSDHMLIPVYGFFALGFSAMVFALAGHLTRFLDDLFSVSSAKTFVLVLLFLPLFKVGFSSYAGFVFGWSDVTSQDASDYAIVSDYVNRNAGAGDIVVGTSHMRRFVDAQNYSILTDSISADGVKVIYYNVLLPPERFFFNASYRNSRYLVLTPGTFEWLRNQSLSGMAEEVGGWPLVFNSSSFVVYENPSYNQPAFEDEQPPEYEEGH